MNVLLANVSYLCYIDYMNKKLEKEDNKLLKSKARRFRKEVSMLQKMLIDLQNRELQVKDEAHKELMAMLKELADFRKSLRQLLEENGIPSNPGWTEQNIVDAFKSLLSKKRKKK